ncbi:hypothetical protein MKHDV_00160 [Halodesulfovibrio sp. MK-HDV]|nr:hypothetical protein MKHDV_00160 [Halodesulfovibrio sp. MK-HDV]
MLRCKVIIYICANHNILTGLYWMNTTTCYERILGIICSVFDAYSAVLIMPDRSGSHFSVASSFSLGDMVNKDETFSAGTGKGLVGWIISNEEPMLVNDFDTRQYNLGYYAQNEETKIKAFMGVPLKNGAGVLCLDSKRQYSFSSKDQKILQLFGELVYEVHSRSFVVEEQVNLSQQYHCLQVIYSLRKHLKKWDSFLSKFLVLLSDTSHFEYCSLATRDEGGQNYHIEGENYQLLRGEMGEIPYGSGLVGWVFKNSTPFFVEGGKAASQTSPLYGKKKGVPQFVSVICIPLEIGGMTRGVLTLASETSKVIPEELKTFCQMASEHLSLFLENLYLRSKLYEAHRQVDDLQRAAAYEHENESLFSFSSKTQESE